MEKPIIMVHITCRKENTEQVAKALSEIFEDVGENPLITVSHVLSQKTSEVVIQTERVYTDKAIDDLFSEPGYTTIMGLPGVLEADVVSPLDESLASSQHSYVTGKEGYIWEKGIVDFANMFIFQGIWAKKKPGVTGREPGFNDSATKGVKFEATSFS
jgi:hypothetical protein